MYGLNTMSILQKIRVILVMPIAIMLLLIAGLLFAVDELLTHRDYMKNKHTQERDLKEKVALYIRVYDIPNYHEDSNSPGAE